MYKNILGLAFLRLGKRNPGDKHVKSPPISPEADTQTEKDSQFEVVALFQLES